MMAKDYVYYVHNVQKNEPHEFEFFDTEEQALKHAFEVLELKEEEFEIREWQVD